MQRAVAERRRYGRAVDDPPGVRSGRHGFGQGPLSGLPESHLKPYSGVVVLPSRTPPLSAIRSTMGTSAVGRDRATPAILSGGEAARRHEILERVGNAAERPRRPVTKRAIGPPRILQRPLGCDRHERVRAAVQTEIRPSMAWVTSTADHCPRRWPAARSAALSGPEIVTGNYHRRRSWTTSNAPHNHGGCTSSCDASCREATRGR